MKITKTACITVVSLATLSGLALASQDVIIRQLDEWQVLPRPARLSELYFTDERQLPSVVKVGAPQKVTFTINNLEHQTTNYNYKIIAVSAKGGTEQLLGEGALTLDHGRSESANKTVLVPAIDTRLAIKVQVEYEAIAFGEEQPQLQTQSISFWAKAEGTPGKNLGEVKHGS